MSNHWRKILIGLFLIWIVVGTLFKTMASTGSEVPEFVWWLDGPLAIVVVAVLCSSLETRKKILVSFFALWVPLKYWIIAVFGLPEFVKLLDDAIVFVAFALCFFAVLYRRQSFGTPIDGLVVSLLIVDVISILLNQVPPLVGLLGIRSLFRFFLLYYVLVWLDINDVELKRFISLTLWTSLIQVILSLGQFRSGLPLTPWRINWALVDQVFGTFGRGTANHFGYYCLMLILMSFTLSLVDRTQYRRYLFFVPLFMIPWVLCSAKGSYVISIPLVFGGLVLFRRPVKLGQHVKPRYLIPVVALFLAFGVYYRGVTGFGGGMLESVRSSLEAQFRYSTSGSGRIVIFRALFDQLVSHPSYFLFGLGTGNISTNLSGLAESTGRLLLADQIGSVSFLPTQILQTIGETGVLGGLLGFAILFRLGQVAYFVYRFARSPFDKAVSLISLSFCTILILGAFIETLWTWQATATYFWFFAAYVTVKKNQLASNAPNPPSMHCWEEGRELKCITKCGQSRSVQGRS